MVEQRTTFQQLRWSVAILAARENVATLASSVRAAERACTGSPAMIDVLVNGNRQLAEKTAHSVQSLTDHPVGVSVRIWAIELADKAHALNQYMETIYPGSQIAYFVDGYAQMQPDSLQLMDDALHRRPDVLGCSGTPSVGRTAKALSRQMVREGGVHGTLYAIRGEAYSRLRECGFRIPLGLYRSDPLMFAVLAFDFDPATKPWDPSRLLVVPEATWSYSLPTWWRLSDLQRQWKRLLRQSQGALENLAIRQHLAVEHGAPSALPATASELVGSWICAMPGAARRVFLRNPCCFVAARRLAEPKDWSAANSPAELLAQVPQGKSEVPMSPPAATTTLT